MARPRIFISSTYYDLKNVRADLHRFIRSRGFDPVLNEFGHIPYGSDEKIEEYCYREIEGCDIVVAIVGGRFGSSSSHDPYSISQQELKTAFDLGRQVHIFVEKAVLAEYNTYRKNKDSEEITYAAVDNVAIYRFLEEVFSLPLNNPVAPFETSADITAYLQEQWAGLFHSLLRETARKKEVRLIDDLGSIASTLKQLVTFLTDERRAGDHAIRDILLTNHPVFEAIRSKINVPYRVFFTNRNELAALLKARGYRSLDVEERDDDTRETHEEWIRYGEGRNHLLKIASAIFEADGKLKLLTAGEWRKEWIMARIIRIDDDDLPF